MPVEWKIFYSDGSYTNEDGPPELAPKRGVQAIAVRDDLIGRRIERSEDHYIWTPENGGWRGVDEFGLFDYLIEPGFKVVLFGRTLSNDDYRATWDRVANDSDLPPRSAVGTDERRP